MHARLRKREYAPANFHDSQPQTWPYTLNDQRARNLYHGVCDRVNTACVRVFVAVHAELFLHAGHVRIGHVALVEILHEEAETSNAEDSSVEFEEQTLLFGSLEVCVGVPDEGAERSSLFGGSSGISGITGGIDLEIMAVDLFPGRRMCVLVDGRHLVALVRRLVLDEAAEKNSTMHVVVSYLPMSCNDLIAWVSDTTVD
jgi:hypothetical protein